MADVTGSRGTINIEQSQREVDMASAISLLEPSAQPLAILSRKARKESVFSPKFEWLEDALDVRYDATAGTATSGATTVDVVTAARFHAQDIVQNTRTAENFRVVSVAAPTLTIVRGVGSTAAAMLLADELLVLGSAQPEGDDIKSPFSTNPVNVFNYTQIFRDTWSSTETLRASKMRHNPGDWEYQANKKGIEHAKSIEYAFIHGRKSQDTSGTQPRRTTGGVLGFIATNATAVGGAMPEATFNTICRSAFRYGLQRKLLLASPIVTSVLNGYPLGKLQFRQDDSTYGLNIGQFIGPFGTLSLVNHWLLEGTKYSGHGIVLDMSEIAYRYLEANGINRDTKILMNRQGPGVDGRQDEVLSECGLMIEQEKTHAVFSGVTG